MHLRLHWPLIRNNFTCTGNTSQILALLTFLLASERKHNFVQNNAFSSVQFSRSVMSDSLQPHGLQHARPPCPSPTPRVHPNPCPSSRWCHPTISSSVVPFSSCPQSFSASGSFQIRCPKYWSFSISPSNEYSGLISFRVDWLYLCSPRDSQESFPAPQFKNINSSALHFLLERPLSAK